MLISGVSAVEPIHLFDVAAQQVRWLSTSQSVIAANVSNASTPGYKSQVVQPFSEVMDKTQLQLAEPPGAQPASGASGLHQRRNALGSDRLRQ